MTRETILSGRQTGKTHYLIERIQEAQDAGAELVAVVTHSANEAQRWADWILEWEIDPSRFIVFHVGQIERAAHGLPVDQLYVDNADLMTPDQVENIEHCFAREIDVLTATG